MEGNRLKRRRWAYLLVAVLAVSTSACQSTGSPRCDQHAGLVTEADKIGYHYDCTPSWTGAPLGWADHDTRTLYVQEPSLSHSGALLKVMYHELGHAYFAIQGRTFSTQRAEECAADAYAKARMTLAQRSGVGFSLC